MNDSAITMGVIDVVKGGKVSYDCVTHAILVESSSDLTNLKGYAAGSIAHTAGFGSMWELDVDGEWQAIE